jgi:predicted secreted protein
MPGPWAPPDLANVSFAANISATAPSEAINALCIPFVIARTNPLVARPHP